MSSKKVLELHERLANGENVSDDEIMNILKSERIMTNTWDAARWIIRSSAPVCAFRPHLVDQLVQRILDPLVMSGIDETQQFTKWVKYELEQPEPFRGLHPAGIKWLKDFIQETDRIENLLDSVIAKNDEYFNAEIRAKFRPQSKLPMEFIDIHHSWKERYWKHPRNGIMFVTVPYYNEIDPRDEREFNIFTVLTEAIASHDKDHQLRFLAFGLDAYTWGDIPRLAEAKSFEIDIQLETVDFKKTEIFWILDGAIIATYTIDDTNTELIENNTVMLLERLNSHNNK